MRRNDVSRPLRYAGAYEMGRNGSANRPDDMKAQVEQTFWTAREWGERTRIPYRSILAAVAKGELAGVRPSGTNRGCILISEASWERWLVEIEVKKRVPPPLGGAAGYRQLSDLALS
jgi:hypothetical protein